MTVTDLVEVDVHALELELGGAIVPMRAVSEALIGSGVGGEDVHATAVEAVLAGDGLPGGEVSIDGSCARREVVIVLTRKRHQFGYPTRLRSVRLHHWVGRFCSSRSQLTHWPVWRWTYRRRAVLASCSSFLSRWQHRRRHSCPVACELAVAVVGQLGGRPAVPMWGKSGVPKSRGDASQACGKVKAGEGDSRSHACWRLVSRAGLQIDVRESRTRSGCASCGKAVGLVEKSVGGEIVDFWGEK